MTGQHCGLLVSLHHQLLNDLSEHLWAPAFPLRLRHKGHQFWTQCVLHRHQIWPRKWTFKVLLSSWWKTILSSKSNLWLKECVTFFQSTRFSSTGMLIYDQTTQVAKVLYYIAFWGQFENWAPFSPTLSSSKKHEYQVVCTCSSKTLSVELSVPSGCLLASMRALLFRCPIMGVPVHDLFANIQLLFVKANIAEATVRISYRPFLMIYRN